jgi:hypothetical protein
MGDTISPTEARLWEAAQVRALAAAARARAEELRERAEVNLWVGGRCCDLARYLIAEAAALRALPSPRWRTRALER